MDTTIHAELSVDVYQGEDKRAEGQIFEKNGIEFQVIKRFDDDSGYQGVLYQNKFSGELILAHRGTEFDRELVKDGMVADGGMILFGVNSQVDAAQKATECALKYAEENKEACGPLALTVTGHSLGGTLAQLTAYRYGLRGETFDAYGAAGLTADMKAGGDQIINHVRATDFVSAASKHVGEVRIYAAEKDIQALERAGYENDGRRWTDLRNPLLVVTGAGVEAHYSRNFQQENDLGISGSIISAENAARYEQYKPMIDKYRGDIALAHGALALPRNLTDSVVDGARQVLTGRDPVEQAAPLRQTGCVAKAVSDARDSSHPDHYLYGQIDRGMRAVDASLGRSPDQFTERASAHLFAEAKMGGITQADHVLMSTGGAGGTGSPNLFVVQGALNDPSHMRVSVPSSEAINTPVEQSFERAANHDRQQAQAQEQQREQQQEHAALTRSM